MFTKYFSVIVLLFFYNCNFSVTKRILLKQVQFKYIARNFLEKDLSLVT